MAVAGVELCVIYVLVTLLTPTLSVMIQMTVKFLDSNYLRTHIARFPLTIFYFIIIILVDSVIMVMVCAVPAPAWTMVMVRTPL